MRSIIVVILTVMIVAAGCKTKSKVAGSSGRDIPVVRAANISLYDKPLTVIRQHVEGQRWQLLYATGGITGKERMNYEQAYYTFAKDGKLVYENDGEQAIYPYTWEKQRDIFTGDSVYVVAGVVNWKVNGIDDDTLRLADNYVDGFSFSLVRSE